MFEYDKLSAKVMGQISLTQSMVTQLPDEESILNFSQQGLTDIPGVESIVFFDHDIVSNVPENDESVYIQKIKDKKACYATFIFQLSAPELFKPYTPFVDNFFNMLTVIFQGLQHRRLNDLLLQDMERMVSERTIELQEEINYRKKAEASLKASKEQLSLALLGGKCGIWDWNLQTNKVFFDDNYYKLAGYEPHAFPACYAEWRKRVHPDDIEAIEKLILECINNKEIEYCTEFRFLTASGDWMWIRSLGRAVDLDNGIPIRFIGIHTNIHEQKLTEIKLINAQHYISNIINSMPSAIIAVTTTGTIVQWNDEAEQTYKVKKMEAIGQSIDQLLPFLKYDLAKIKRAISTEKVIIEHKRIHYKNNRCKHLDVTIYPLTDKNTDGAVIRIDDITKRVKMEELVIQSEKMVSVGGLAAGMAHEINNPLAGIMQTASVMKDRLDNTELPANVEAAKETGCDLNNLKSYMEARGIFKMLQRIQDSGARAADIVSNMLSFVRKSSDPENSFNVPELIDRCLELCNVDYNLKKKYDFKQIKITRKYEEKIPEIFCHGGKIQQVIMNILRNGAEAMHELKESKSDYQPEFSLRVSREHTKDMIRIEISDNGPGISEQNKKHIFEPFFTTKETNQGTGLGLSISYFIITEIHKGTLHVESIPEKGTTFIIRLPFPGINNK